MKGKELLKDIMLIISISMLVVAITLAMVGISVPRSFYVFGALISFWLWKG